MNTDIATLKQAIDTKNAIAKSLILLELECSESMIAAILADDFLSSALIELLNKQPDTKSAELAKKIHDFNILRNRWQWNL